MVSKHLFVALAITLGTQIAAGQITPGQAAPGEPHGNRAEPAFKIADRAWTEFLDRHGDSWIVRYRPETGHARLVFGGRTAPPTDPPLSDEDFEAIARAFLDNHQDLFGIPVGSLFLSEVAYSSLASIGTSNKIGVIFQQIEGGVEVEGGWVSVLLHEDGAVIAAHSEARPDAADLSVIPRFADRAARELVASDFDRRHGLLITEMSDAELVIHTNTLDEAETPRLAWSILVTSRELDRSIIPTIERVWIDAEAGTVLDRRSQVHDADILGTIEGKATPGTSPDSGSNPPLPAPLRDIEVVAATVGTTITDGQGDFLFSGVGSGTYNVSAALEGLYCRVENIAGTEASVSGSFQTGVPQTLTFNASPSEQRTAEVNAFYWVMAMRTWLLSIDPSYDITNFQVLANVNLNNNCNAYYDGSSINFYTSGGGCVNTAYSTVVAHEEGHWLNVLAGSGNGSDGFGEGAADIWAMFLVDDPIVGKDFSGPGSNIRTGENTRQFCGDANPGCHGGVHANGEVLMGAFWKWRQNLNSTHGDTAGDAIADALMLAWFKLYNDGQIRTIVRDHILILDDDDGNVNNGTPNFTDINAGFVAQGFPPFDLQPLSITHSPLDDTQDQTGPYPVTAVITSNVGSNVTSATLYWNTGGSDTPLSMTPTGNPDEYTADIPGQPAPSVVSYWIEASDDQANNIEDPIGAPGDGTHRFIVGTRGVPFFFDDLESANGWTHGGSGQDDWQLGTPQGQAEDPSSAFSGVNVWANDLGLSGWNGVYSNNVDNWLLSPSIDCTNSLGTRLEFMRWLNVEKANWDQARIEVSIAGGSFQVVWENDFAIDHLENSWQQQLVDISDPADGQSNVRIRFHLTTDTSVTFGGWTIDDIGLTALEDSTDDTAPNAPSDLASSTHTVGQWSGETTVSVNWTPATDDDSGLDGYSILWDQQTSTVPDTVKDLEEGETSLLDSLVSSNTGWYFHIRAVDNAGNWGSSVHFGPVLIDASPPDAPTDLSSPTHSQGEWSQNDNATVTWTTANDPIGSGLDGYSFVWDQSSGTVPDITKDLEEGATSSSQQLASSNNAWYFHVRSVDNVGNWSSAVHFGPILIDASPPDAPTNLSSPTHNLGEWSQNDNATATWTTASDPIGSGLDGYSFVWDQSPVTEPDLTKDLEEDATSSDQQLASSPSGWYFHVRSVDNVGNWGAAVHLGPILVDLGAPTGSLNIEAGAAFTTDVLVDLQIDGFDAESGLATMEFSNDGVSWSGPEPFDTDKIDWNLTLFGGHGDPGIKTVYMRIADIAGNLSAVIADTIDYRPVPVITLVTPSVGSFEGGYVVEVFGSGFSPDTLVAFGRHLSMNVTWMSSTLLQVEVPPAVIAQPSSERKLMILPVDVSVATLGGTDTLPDGFVYLR